MKEISDNLLSAFLEGNASPEDTVRVLEAAKSDPEIREVIETVLEMEEEERRARDSVLPLAALAADESENRCAVMCELYVLSLNGVERSLQHWEQQAARQGWLRQGGTPIHCIGRLLEQECFSVSRTFHNSIEDLRKAIQQANVIAAVDGKELSERPCDVCREKMEDDAIGPDPNHAVVVLGIDDRRVRYYEPSSGRVESTSIERFEDAWSDSSRFMVKVMRRDFSRYEPHPIDLSDVELPDDLIDLREAIAENAHEVWAKGRKDQGWSYGPQRDDALKQTPDMVPYSDLTDQEKFFDREMAINTIKLLKKLGYSIIKD